MSVTNADRLQPWAQWEEVDVLFDAVANTDTIVQHSLSPPTPEHVNYIPIRKSQAADVYHDTAGTRKIWGSGYIILRSPIASARVTLLLTVSHNKRSLVF